MSHEQPPAARLRAAHRRHARSPRRLAGPSLDQQLPRVIGCYRCVERSDAALVGRQLAARRKLQVGDQLTVGEISVYVAGTFASEFPAEEDLIYCQLPFLQLRQGRSGAGVVTQLEVHLAPTADPDGVAREIDAHLRSGPVATTTRRKGAFQAGTIADLVDLIGYAHWLGVACVLLVLSLVATTTVMSVQDRIREHAVLQTLGMRPLRLMRIIVTESAAVCLLGGVLGTVAAWFALHISNLSVGTEGVAIVIRPSMTIAGLGLVTSIAVGILAGVIPAWQAARAAIVPALRHV